MDRVVERESEAKQKAFAAGAMARLARRANAVGAPRGDGNSARWCVLVRERATRLEAELERLEATPLSEERESMLIEARAHVASVRRLTIGNAKYKQWSSDSLVENAWSHLRAAEEMIVDLVADAELPALAADAIAHAKYYLKSGDEHVAHLAKVRKAYPPGGRSSRPGRGACGDACGDPPRPRRVAPAGRHVNREVRVWRNRLLIGSCITVAATLATIFVLWRIPEIEPIDVPRAGATGRGRW